jgi:predicted permease
MDFRRYVRDRLPPLALQREPEILDEIAQHLADLYEEGRAAGLDHQTALDRANEALSEYPDNLARDIRSASRALPGLIADRWRGPADEPPPSPGFLSMMSDLPRDLRYAVRMAARTPGVTFTVAMTMTLAIGAATVIFSAVDALLLRSAPVADPSRVVSVYTANAGRRDAFSSSSYPDYVDLRDSAALDGLAAFAGISLSFDTAGETLPVAGEVVSGNYFDVLGVPIAMGRRFRPGEDRPGNPVRVAVVSHEFWTKHFANDASAIGRSIELNGHAYTVIGVTPRNFTSPILGRAPEVWVPMAVQPEVRPPSAGVRRSLGHANLLGSRDIRWLNMIGRLRRTSSLEQAASAMHVVAARLSADESETNARTFTVVWLGEGPGVRVAARPLLWMLSAAVLLVLLLACANVASVLLARAISRRREVAVRLAVGANRARLVRSWLTESVLLSLLGACGGMAIARFGAPVLHSVGIPATVDLGLNWRVLAFTLGIAVTSGVLFGIAPILQTFKVDTLTALRDEGGAVATGARAVRMRRAFVVVQVALSVMLLIGAGLFLRTLNNAYAVDLGYRVDGMLLADLNLDIRGYSPDAGEVFYRDVLDRVSAIPGITAAGMARVTVLAGGARSSTISTDGRPLDRAAGNGLTVRANVISAGYLDAMGIGLLRGRDFDARDDERGVRVAIVSRTLAERLWPGGDPLGKALVTGVGPVQVIGVVPDSVYVSSVERNAPPFFYLPLSQNYESGVTLHVRTDRDPLTFIVAVRQAVRDVDPQVMVARPRTLRDEFATSVTEQRLMAIFVGFFGAVAFVLAAVGVYGTMSHLAGQRTAEVGIRLALGAEPSVILWMLVADGLRLVAIGAALGLAGAFAATRLLKNQLFGIAPTDPVTFIGVIVLLLAVGFLACALPARRAMRVDPVVALRGA